MDNIRRYYQDVVFDTRGTWIPFERPFLISSMEEVYALSDPIHNWFSDINPNYYHKVSLGREPIEGRLLYHFYLDFDDNELAILFKLAWL